MLSRFTRVINPLRVTTAAFVRSATQLDASVMHVDFIQQPTPTLSLHNLVLTRNFATCPKGFGQADKSSIIEIGKVVNDPELAAVCNEAAKLLGLNATNFRKKLISFFIEGNETMKGNYGDSLLKYAIGMRDGITNAITFSDDQAQTKEELRALYIKGITFRGSVRICDFANVTGRVSHLIGLKEEGFLSYEQVRDLKNSYNRFGLNGKDEDLTFRVLTSGEVRKLIKTGQLLPVEAKLYAEKLQEDPRANNLLSPIFSKILSSNHQRGAAFGVTC